MDWLKFVEHLIGNNKEKKIKEKRFLEHGAEIK